MLEIQVKAIITKSQKAQENTIIIKYRNFT